ncbi:TnsD family transposase [Sporosarcina sp. FSL K6-1522]|uniref:TnsD family transposase n=1 Tax=Sporosarcina sp. FSL K6-1522 TaxID=2921554 RepID=UPI00315B01B3
MHFFPPLYPDELLYSALARYHTYSGNESIKKTNRDLFGCNTVCSATDLPCRLDILSKRIPGGNISKEKLLQEHTLLPYYSHFISRDRLEKILYEMYFNYGSSIHMLVGLIANGVKPPRNLRYCTFCVRDNRNQYGLAYWHRSHQLPGVTVCYKHQIQLSESDVLYAQRSNKHEFVALDSITLNLSTDGVFVENQLSLFIAQNSYYLLNFKFEGTVSIDDIRYSYLNELQKLNMLSAKGRVKFSKLIPIFNNYYSQDLLESMGSKVEGVKQYTWIHKVLRGSGEAIHPLRHILLHAFFGMNVVSTIKKGDFNITVTNPFGSGPWPCLNKAASHFGEKIILSCATARCSDTGKPVGTFTCNCGFVYARRGPDISEIDQMKIGRIKKFGGVWKTKLYELWADEKLSLREKARQLGVAPQTVKRKAEFFSETNKYNSNKTHEKLNHMKIKRTEWLSFKDEKPSSQRTAVYKWLYKHDKDWLMQNRPKYSRSKPNNNRIDWVQRDEEMAKQVKEIANQLKSIKHVRITKTEIGRKIGALSLIQKSLQKLPKTKRTLENVVETTEQYRIRRADLNI